jgi:hypothetical protein
MTTELSVAVSSLATVPNYCAHGIVGRGITPSHGEKSLTPGVSIRVDGTQVMVGGGIIPGHCAEQLATPVSVYVDDVHGTAVVGTIPGHCAELLGKLDPVLVNDAQGTAGSGIMLGRCARLLARAASACLSIVPRALQAVASYLAMSIVRLK